MAENKTTNSNSSENAKFELALQQLELTVRRLEGDIPLDEAVGEFEKGLSLSRICMENLKAQKGKLLILIDDLNKLTEEFKID